MKKWSYLLIPSIIFSEQSCQSTRIYSPNGSQRNRYTLWPYAFWSGSNVGFKTCNKREIVSSPSHLKLGILSTFSGMGPEKRLFSIFLLRHKTFRKQAKDSIHQAELWDFPKLSIKMNLIAIWKLNKKIVEASTSLSVEDLVEHQGFLTADCSANAWKQNN